MPNPYRTSIAPLTATCIALSLLACEGPVIPEDPPVVQLDQAEVTFSAMEAGSDPTSVSVRIANDGDGTLAGIEARVSYDGAQADWLNISLDRTSAPAVLRLSVSLAGLAPGSHPATVRVSASNGAVAASLDVTLDVEALPEISLSESEVAFVVSEGSGSPPTREVSIENTGGGNLSALEAEISADLGQPSDWLTATVDSMASPLRLMLEAQPGRLPPGRYRNTVVVSTSDPVPLFEVLQVELVVQVVVPQPLPNLRFGDMALDIGAVEPAATIDLPTVVIENEGPGWTPSFRTAVYLSSDTTVSSDDSVLHTELLDTLQESTQAELRVTSVDLPANAPEGDYWLLIVADDLGEIAEADESDNQIRAPLAISIAQPDEFTLSLRASPLSSGRISMSPARKTYGNGDLVTLTAEPSTGYAFAGWSGDLTGSRNPATVIMTSDRTITAEFEILPPALEATDSLGTIELSWTFRWPCVPRKGGLCASSGAEHFQLEESDSPRGGFVPVFTSDPTRESSFSHTIEREPGVYYFRVRGQDSGWASAYSDVVTVEVNAERPLAPTDIRIAVDSEQLTVSWRDNSANEDGFQVEISARPNFRSTLATVEVGANGRSATWTDTQAPRAVFVRVRAFNDAGGATDGNVYSAESRSSFGFLRIESEYGRVVRLRLNDVEYITESWDGIDAGEPRTYSVSPGTYDYLVAWGGYGGQVVGTEETTGSVSLTANDTTVLRFEAPRPEERLTLGNESQTWEGRWRDGFGALHIATYVFHDDDTYSLSAPGFDVSSGLFSHVDAGVFIAGRRRLELRDGDAYFEITDGPPSQPVIQFRPN